LAEEQGLLDQPVPDDEELATAVWPTKEDVEEALRYLTELRQRHVPGE
jgi:hypothetical protein